MHICLFILQCFLILFILKKVCQIDDNGGGRDADN